jgi:hypothetical protein
MTEMTSIFLIVFVLVLGVLAILVIYGTIVKNSWGITFSKVNCPHCQAAQPLVRKPAGAREGLWGGYTCAKCGTKMDKWGRARI